MIPPEKLTPIETERVIQLSEFLSVVINNYGIAEGNAIRLRSLQEWIDKPGNKK